MTSRMRRLSIASLCEAYAFGPTSRLVATGVGSGFQKPSRLTMHAQQHSPSGHDERLTKQGAWHAWSE